MVLRHDKQVALFVSLIAAGCLASCAAITQLDKYENVECIDCNATPDSGVVVVDGAPKCAHLFCSDFDEGSFAAAGWPNHASNANVTIQINQQVYTSMPASFLVALPASQGPELGGNLSVGFPELPNKGAHLHFALNIGAATSSPLGPDASPDDTDVIQIATIGAPSDFPKGGGGVSLVWLSSGLAVMIATTSDAGVTNQFYPLSMTPTSGAWTQVQLDVTFSASGAGNLSVTLGTTNVLTVPGLTTATSTAVSTTLGIGAISTGSTAAFQANFDDLWFDLDQ